MKGEAHGLVANRGAITISIMLAPIMQGVDTTIANVALPHMQGSLSVAQNQIARVLTSYIVAAAIMTPLTDGLRRAHDDLLLKIRRCCARSSAR